MRNVTGVFDGVSSGQNLGDYYQCWLNDQNGYWFNSPEAMRFATMPDSRGNMYQRVRGIWELLQEVLADDKK